MITSTITVDIRVDTETADRKALGPLTSAPRGSKINIYVGDRTFAAPWAVSWLAKFVTYDILDFHGSVEATNEWMRAVREAELA